MRFLMVKKKRIQRVYQGHIFQFYPEVILLIGVVNKAKFMTHSSIACHYFGSSHFKCVFTITIEKAIYNIGLHQDVKFNTSFMTITCYGL